MPGVAHIDPAALSDEQLGAAVRDALARGQRVIVLLEVAAKVEPSADEPPAA